MSAKRKKSQLKTPNPSLGSDLQIQKPVVADTENNVDVKDEEFTLFEGETPVLSNYRGLIGWMNEADAVHFLLGRQPGDKDNLTTIKQEIEKYHSIVKSRPISHLENPISQLDETNSQKISSRPDIQSTFASLIWSPVLIDLRKVLSYQKLINLDGLETRVASVTESLDSLINFCLPINEPLNKVGAIIDGDQKGYTISSLNPNLRIMGAQMQDANVAPGPGLPPIKAKAVSFVFGIGSSYLQVGLYKDRYFIRDGYHRAYGLLKKGINIVPCILIEARDTNELGLKPGMFTFEEIYGERPPGLIDFLDDSVACDGKRIAMRTVIRFRGEEFAVQR